MEVELESETQQGAHEVGGRALGGQARPPPSWQGGGAPGLHLWQVFFLFSEKCLVKFQAIPRTFAPAHK